MRIGECRQSVRRMFFLNAFVFMICLKVIVRHRRHRYSTYREVACNRLEAAANGPSFSTYFPPLIAPLITSLTGSYVPGLTVKLDYVPLLSGLRMREISFCEPTSV
ncbi:hypothetical protein BD309DRAFT_945089 [Dichomitus squalens]|uniref:Uncharacterized protein n=1 Tax=Dichomitus squalens TaxID=114155 RepID=A0A4Q9MXU2_9APHY|nr:hypothetical protein BD311DRAFT_59826 [Dichomitus squalens]TBU50487.1 hypothetical protein BD309DRAFT_945089 [Dichomitus squalens]